MRTQAQVERTFNAIMHCETGSTVYRFKRRWSARRITLWSFAYSHGQRRLNPVSDWEKQAIHALAKQYSAAHPRTLVTVETAGGLEMHFYRGRLYGVNSINHEILAKN